MPTPTLNRETYMFRIDSRGDISAHLEDYIQGFEAYSAAILLERGRWRHATVLPPPFWCWTTIKTSRTHQKTCFTKTFASRWNGPRILEQVKALWPWWENIQILMSRSHSSYCCPLWLPDRGLEDQDTESFHRDAKVLVWQTEGSIRWIFRFSQTGAQKNHHGILKSFFVLAS